MFFGNFRDKLLAESKSWIDDEIISNEQFKKILVNYDESENKKNSLGYYLLVSFSALFFGVACMLLMSHNWDDIPNNIKTISLFLFTLSLNLLGAHKFVKGKEQLGSVILLFGSLMLGVSIMLIAQIYHLGDYYPDGIYWWAMGVFPMLILTRNRYIGLLVVCLSTLWMITDFKEGFFPLTYPVFIFASLVISLYLEKSKALFSLSFAGGMTWIFMAILYQMENIYSVSDHDFFVVLSLITVISYAFILRLSNIVLPYLSKYKNNDINWGEYCYFLFKIMLFTTLISLLFLSFNFTWKEFNVKNIDYGIIFGLILLSIFSVVINLKSDLFSRIFISSFSGYIVLSILMVSVFSLPYFTVVILTNFFLFLSSIGLIYYGVISNRTYFYYVGIFGIISLAIIRYFQLAGDYIGSSIIFIFSAFVLMASAKFWKKQQASKLKGHNE
jgi:uncharacterized membrane protein